MPTVYLTMSKRCAIGYAACDACAEKQKATGNMGILPDYPLTLEAVKAMKRAMKWPPKCAFCGGPYPYRIELEAVTPEEIQAAVDAVQESLL
jgi:hypothetical protein